MDRLALHRKGYRIAIRNTVLFYGSVLVICLVFNVLVALAIVLFFLKFYRKEILAALFHPVSTIFSGRKPWGDKYRFEILKPFETFAEGP